MTQLKTILKKYASYTECYLDFWKNYFNVNKFLSDKKISGYEFAVLCEARKSMPENLPLCALDVYTYIYIDNHDIKTFEPC